MTFLLAVLAPDVPGADGALAAPPGARSRSKSRARRSRPPPPPESASAQPASEESAPPVRGPTRIDFDDRLIQGQTNQSGAVYLYERKELKLRSMVKVRESFRGETVRVVYDEPEPR